MDKTPQHKTLVISDVHLGASASKAKELVKFLKKNTCERLIMNGDIIDGWQLKRSGKWRKRHTRFFKQIMKMIEKDQTEVIYIRGNHDDFLDQVMPLRIGNLIIKRDHIIESGGKRYYITHGDLFDTITTHMKWLSMLGDMGYTLLLWINKKYNQRRAKKGLPYYSLSQEIKKKVKSAVKYISDFEESIIKVAKVKKCDGVICGHIHTPDIKMMNGVEYMNSGDWVESMSALAEDFNGRWQIIYYEEMAHDREDENSLKKNEKTLKKTRKKGLVPPKELQTEKERAEAV